MPMTFRELRIARGFRTATRLAEKTGTVKLETISQLDLGKVGDPRLSTLEPLAKAMRVSMETLAKAIRSTRAA